MKATVMAEGLTLNLNAECRWSAVARCRQSLGHGSVVGVTSFVFCLTSAGSDAAAGLPRQLSGSSTPEALRVQELDGVFHPLQREQ